MYTGRYSVWLAFMATALLLTLGGCSSNTTPELYTSDDDNYFYSGEVMSAMLKFRDNGNVTYAGIVAGSSFASSGKYKLNIQDSTIEFSDFDSPVAPAATGWTFSVVNGKIESMVNSKGIVYSHSSDQADNQKETKKEPRIADPSGTYADAEGYSKFTFLAGGGFIQDLMGDSSFGRWARSGSIVEITYDDGFSASVDLKDGYIVYNGMRMSK